MSTATLFPVARPRGAAAALLAAGPAGRARVAEAVALAFDIRESAPRAMDAHAPLDALRLG